VAWLSGIIDLVYRHAGRWCLIDWKSNRLRPGLRYTAPKLVQAVADSGYELQQLLCAVALAHAAPARLSTRHLRALAVLVRAATGRDPRHPYTAPVGCPAGCGGRSDPRCAADGVGETNRLRWSL